MWSKLFFFFTLFSCCAAQNGLKTKTTNATANLRSEPTSLSSIICAIPANSEIEITGDRGAYWEALSGDKAGYIIKLDVGDVSPEQITVLNKVDEERRLRNATVAQQRIIGDFSTIVAFYPDTLLATNSAGQLIYAKVDWGTLKPEDFLSHEPAMYVDRPQMKNVLFSDRSVFAVVSARDIWDGVPCKLGVIVNKPFAVGIPKYSFSIYYRGMFLSEICSQRGTFIKGTYDICMNPSRSENPGEFYVSYKSLVNNGVKILAYKIDCSGAHVTASLVIKNTTRKIIVGLNTSLKMYDKFMQPVTWGGGDNVFAATTQDENILPGQTVEVGPWELVLYDRTRRLKPQLTKIFFAN